MNTKHLAAALLMGLLIVTPALAQQPEQQRDDIIMKDVIDTIAVNYRYTIFDNVRVNVADGVVTLTGHVTMPFKKDTYKKAILKRVPDIVRIEDELEVLPVSGEDDRIRRAVAWLIYNDDRLLRYSLEPFPRAIHIIVINGQVYLEGQVANRLDALMVYSKARYVFGVLQVHNNLEIL